MAARAKIILTDATCEINGTVWKDIPTIVWPDGIAEFPSDWLRSLVVEHGVQSSSAKEYAKILRQFLEFCRARKRQWNTVDDQFLIIWRDHLHRARKVSENRVNDVLKTIFAFYKWGEESNILRYHVGVYVPGELPAELRDHPFPITAKRWFRKSARGPVLGGWTTSLLLSTKESSTPTRHTPTEVEIQRLHEVVMDTRNGERDSLLFSWAEETGARRAEILSIRLTDLPNSTQLAECIDGDLPWTLSIKRKGGSRKPIIAPPDLLIRTLEYINFTRQSIVDACRKRVTGYREPEQVFISSTTGTPLHPDSVTSLGRDSFFRAGIANASGHRLRARFAVRVIESLVDALFDGDLPGPESSWAETILIKAAEMMGQASPSSLRPYLNYVLNSRIQTASSSKAERLASRLRQMALHESALVKRLAEQKELQTAARMIRSGDASGAAALLEALAGRLRAPATA